MKIYHELEQGWNSIPEEDTEKIALLKLTETGKYIEGVGMRDGPFYVLAESATDDIFVKYKAQMLVLQQMTNIHEQMDQRLFLQKELEYSTKHNQAYSRFLEIPH